MSAQSENCSEVLAITGMHRSGTSMVANYLQRCGVNMGDAFYPADVGNPRGYYEDVDFLNFHQDLLAFFGLSIFPTNDRQLRQPIPEEFRLRAQAILHKEGQSLVWGWKDCRTSLFLEFWRELIPNMNVLFLLRHPVSVVDSLLRRGTDKIIKQHPAIAFRSWWVYNQRILHFYCQNQANCFLVDISDLVHDPTEAASQLFLKLKIDLPVQNFDTIYAPEAFKASKSAGDISLMLRHPFQTLRCLQLYHHMKQLADWP